jgi:hypothetical protein
MRIVPLQLVYFLYRCVYAVVGLYKLNPADP